MEFKQIQTMVSKANAHLAAGDAHWDSGDKESARIEWQQAFDLYKKASR